MNEARKNSAWLKDFCSKRTKRRKLAQDVCRQRSHAQRQASKQAMKRRMDGRAQRTDGRLSDTKDKRSCLWETAIKGDRANQGEPSSVCCSAQQSAEGTSERASLLAARVAKLIRTKNRREQRNEETYYRPDVEGASRLGGQPAVGGFEWETFR